MTRISHAGFSALLLLSASPRTASKSISGNTRYSLFLLIISLSQTPQQKQRSIPIPLTAASPYSPQLPLFTRIHAYITPIALLIHHTILHGLHDRAILLIDMRTIGLGTLVQVRTELDKTLHKFLRRNIPGRQPSNSCRVSQPTT